MSPYQTTTLPNGLRIVHRSSESPVSYCGVMVDCGTRHEAAPYEYGLAHFVEHILFKGTRHRDSWHINNRMESVGGELNAFTTKEETTYYAIGLNKDVPRAVELLCDLVCHPTAPEEELHKEQEVVIDEIMSYRDTPAELIYDELENVLFSDSPLGHNILGSEQSVHTFGHEAAMAFIGRHYRPERMVFFHQGRTPFAQVVRLVERHFDAAGMTPVPVASAPFLSGAEVPSATESHHAQAHVMLGARSYPIGHPDGAALALVCNMLGGPGMNSRLGLELRERRGLVYSVDCTVNTYTDDGCVGIYFGCDHHDVQRCLRLCHSQLERLAGHLLSPRQLLAAQKQLCGQLGVGMANLENNAIAMAKNLLRRGHVETLDETCQRVMAVTPDALQRVAAEVFHPDRLQLVTIL